MIDPVHEIETSAGAEEPAHDVLAAEEFAMPAPDPALHHAPVSLPEDPSGIAEPHDVLAAEEFAMPAALRSPAGGGALRQSGRLGARLLIAAAGALVALVARRLLHSRPAL
ncbi:MAG: hypothetical protein DLM64_14950 [Solirubrobacterales bacterium]|nr:MAG: hypothetical protein DLM64_14950 [Solirubrobacterales bacterium]